MRRKTAIWLGVAALIVLVLGANVHLLYLAIASQPDCVAHEAPGVAPGGSFSAAQSSCSPQAQGTSQ
jgi:hypothetical protein